MMMNIRFRTLLLSLFSILTMIQWSAAAGSGQFRTAPLFADGMVLQQQRQVSVWGKGVPHAVVRIRTSWGINVNCSVLKDGSWKTLMQTPSAGGPHTITLRQNSDTVTLRNVMIGEVWLCSGQSNMEMPLRGWPPADTISGSAAEIAQARFPKIRMFTVERKIAAAPEFDAAGSWKECTPDEAAEFSATAYYFGKRLYEELNVPVGLIHASWGGTPVQSWTSEQFITKHPQYSSFPAQLKKMKSEYQTMSQWLSTLPSVDLSSFQNSPERSTALFGDSAYSAPGSFDSSWSVMDLPKSWEQTAVGQFDGVVWFRKQITLPPSCRGKELVLELGPIDDLDVTLVNGTRVGGMESGSPWNIDRIYTVPSGLTNDSVITLSVRVTDFGGGGGPWGSADQMRLYHEKSGESVPLSGPWKYLPIAEIRNGKAYLFTASNGSKQRPVVESEFTAWQPTSLYNGMIAPLIPYSIKGAIWYQGESNTNEPDRYAELFPLMIRNWRSDWRADLPFYFVQIAPFRYDTSVRSERLREAQLRTLSVPKTGMAVTLDIGDSATIHPSIKHDVGERLARLALAKNYRKKAAYTGPVFRSFAAQKDIAVLTFDHAEGLSVRPAGGKNYFVIAGADKIFYLAEVIVKGSKLFVRSEHVKSPKAVRYAWGNIVEGVLFNKEGLPASSFRTDKWD